MFCDNQSAIKVATDNTSNKRTRHTDRECCIANEVLFQKKMSLQWIGTKEQLANIFTKCLTPEIFLSLIRSRVMGII
jgi:hypothetical protein